nr:hypothetical protein [uncultured Sphingomonas sp.]
MRPASVSPDTAPTSRAVETGGGGGGGGGAGGGGITVIGGADEDGESLLPPPHPLRRLVATPHTSALQTLFQAIATAPA